MPLATVKLISDPEATQAFLWPHIRRAYPSVRRIATIDVHPLGSVQAGRGVVHISVRCEAAGRRWLRLELFGNYDTRGGSKMIYRFLVYLRRHGFGRGAYGIPTPLCYSEKYKLLVYESFPGKRVRDTLEAKKLTLNGLLRVMRQSAVWLRKFHRLPTGVGAARTLRLSTDYFSGLPPAHRAVINRALPFINREVARRDLRSLVHGDPHLANCIQGTHRSFAFIDYSESHIGSPAADIAMYLIHLDVALQPFFRRHQIAQAQRVFLETYYGRSIGALPLRTRQSLLAYELRTAALFLRFTSDHHRQPSKQVAWMIQHFVNIVSRGTDALRSADPHIVLAS